MKIYLLAILLFINCFGYSQKVGVNTILPQMALHVTSQDSANLLLANSQTFIDSIKTGLFFKTGQFFTGAIKTHVQNAAAQEARLGFFTYSGTAVGLRERLSISDEGYVGIGTVKPLALLHVSGNTIINGTLKLIGGSPGAGKVLTSDASGQASWQSPNPLVTKTINISYASLQATLDQSLFVRSSLEGSVYFQNGSSRFNAIVAPLLLPEGSLITKISVIVYDNNPNSGLGVELLKYTHAAGAINITTELLMTNSNDASTVQKWGSVLSLSTTNLNTYYVIKCFPISNTWPGGSLQIYSFEVEYL